MKNAGLKKICWTFEWFYHWKYTKTEFSNPHNRKDCTHRRENMAWLKPRDSVFTRWGYIFQRQWIKFMQMYPDYLPIFVTNSVFQLLAKSDIPRRSLEHIARPKVRVVLLCATRSRRECGDFRRSVERNRHSKLVLWIIPVFSFSYFLEWFFWAKNDRSFRRNDRKMAATRQ